MHLLPSLKAEIKPGNPAGGRRDLASEYHTSAMYAYINVYVYIYTHRHTYMHISVHTHIYVHTHKV